MAEKGFKGFSCKGEFNIPASLFERGGEPITGSFDFNTADSSIESTKTLFDLIMKLRETFNQENERAREKYLQQRCKNKDEEIASLKKRVDKVHEMISELEIVTEGRYSRRIQMIRDVLLNTNASQNVL